MHIKDPVVNISLVDYENTEITQRALKVSVFIMLKLDTTQKRRRRERKEEAALPDGKSQQMIRLGQNVERLGRDVTGTAE